MGHAILLNLNGRPVWSTDCSFRILHQGREVALLETQQDVVRWFQKTRAKWKTWLAAEMSAFGLILCKPHTDDAPLTWRVHPVRKSDLAAR